MPRKGAEVQKNAWFQNYTIRPSSEYVSPADSQYGAFLFDAILSFARVATAIFAARSDPGGMTFREAASALAIETWGADALSYGGGARATIDAMVRENASFFGATGLVEFDPSSGDRKSDVSLYNFFSDGISGHYVSSGAYRYQGEYLDVSAGTFWPGGATTAPPLSSFPKCDAGFRFSLGIGCVACAAGSYAAGESTERQECTLCERGKYAHQTSMSECSRCDYGTFTDQLGSTYCERCPDGATCADAMSVVINPGYWQPPHTNTYSVYSCPIADACIGGSSFGEGLCAPGFVGPLCAECASNYYQTWTTVKACKEVGECVIVRSKF